MDDVDGPAPGGYRPHMDGHATGPPGVPVITACPCKDCPGAVDLTDARHPEDGPLHLSAAEWAEFRAAVKDGHYDTTGD